MQVMQKGYRHMIGSKYDIEYSTSVETPHPDWVRPFVNGPLKAFFMPGILFGREFIELAQRMDIEFDTVTVEKNWDLNKWGLGEYYHIRGGIGDFRIAYQNLEDAMTSDQWYDVLVLPSLNGWGYFGRKTLDAITERVEKGAGLVMVKPFKGEGTGCVEQLDRLSPLEALFNEGFAASKFGGEGFPKVAFEKLTRDKWKAKSHYITSGVPFDIFPYDEMAFYPYKANGEIILESAGGMPIGAVRQVGLGRVAAFGWYPRDILPQHADYRGEENTYDTIIDHMPGARHSLGFNYLEYFYSLVYRSMIWAAGREPMPGITSMDCNEGTLALKGHFPPGAGFRARISDAWGNKVYDTTSMQPSFKIPGWISLGGRFRADAFLTGDDGITDWHTIGIEYPAVAEITKVALADAVYKVGDILRGGFTVKGSAGELTIDVLDDYGRVLHRLCREVIDGPDFEFEWTVRDNASLHVFLRAEIRVGGHLVCRRESGRAIVTPQKRTLDDIEIFMNSHNRGQGDFWDLALRCSLELGITGTFPENTKVLAMSGAEGLGIYWYYRFPYVERKEAYIRSGDKKDLVRIPCLNDAAFWIETEARMLPELEQNKVFAPISYYANDEGSLTCYTNELDLCFCPNCLEGMRAWLKTAYPSLEDLNASWGTSYSDWNSVTPYTFEEADSAREFASWGDHRRFMELTFAGSYEKIARIIRSVDPAGIIRMSGCQETTPYTGYDYYLLHRHIGYFEAYGSGNQFELHRSFARPGTIIGAWLGYGAKGMTVKHAMWEAMFHGITLISIFIEPSILNPDFTFFSGGIDMGDAAKEMRRGGIGKLLLHTAARDNLGIAVHYSVASHHGTYARKDYPRFNAARQGWLEVLEDAGYQYDMIATQQIESDELACRKFKVLILPYSIALSPAETTAILRFAQNGGTVVADMQTGIMDEHCKLHASGSLDGLFGIERFGHRTRPFSGDDCIRAVDGFEYPSLNAELLMEQEVEFPIAEPGVRLTTGKAAFVDDFMRKMPVITVNQYGKGLGIYLNCTFDAFQGKPDNSAFIKDTLSKILVMGGVEKPVQLMTEQGGAIGSGYEVFGYTDGGVRYTALLHDLGGGKKILYDGRTKESDLVGQAEESISLKINAPAHVYDIREKAYLGFTDCFRVSIPAGDCGIYSMLPHRVNSITIESSDTARPGRKMRFDIFIASGKPPGSYSNVLSINLFNPAGEFQWIYSENVSVLGYEYIKECELPVNETPGLWEIVVADTATGVAGRKTFMVE